MCEPANSSATRPARAMNRLSSCRPAPASTPIRMPILPTTLPRRTTRPMFRASRTILLACVLGAAGLAQAQLFQDPEWKETEAPPAPAFDPNKLVPVEMPPYMTLKFGIDPSTIKVTGDGVVRYVVVASHREGGGF